MWNCYFSVNSRWLLVITDSLKGGTRMSNVFQNLAWNAHRRCVRPIHADSEAKWNRESCVFQTFQHLDPGLPRNKPVTLTSLSPQRLPELAIVHHHFLLGMAGISPPPPSIHKTSLLFLDCIPVAECKGLFLNLSQCHILRSSHSDSEYFRGIVGLSNDAQGRLHPGSILGKGETNQWVQNQRCNVFPAKVCRGLFDKGRRGDMSCMLCR